MKSVLRCMCSHKSAKFSSRAVRTAFSVGLALTVAWSSAGAAADSFMPLEDTAEPEAAMAVERHSAAVERHSAGETLGDFWLRAYSVGEIGESPDYFLPDYYETEAETVVRDEVARFLSGTAGKVSATDETGLRISYSVKVDRPPAKGLPQSPIRLEPERPLNRDPASVDIGSTESGVRPVLAFGSRPKKGEKQTTVRVSLYVLNDSERVWSGFAQTALGGAPVSERTRDLTILLTEYWGVTAILDGPSDLEAPPGD